MEGDLRRFDAGKVREMLLFCGICGKMFFEERQIFWEELQDGRI